MLCSVTCTDMLFHICGVMLCCIYYVTYVILCYICNVMVHASYKMHYVTCFATNIVDTLCYIHYITYVTHVMSHTLLPFIMYSILRFIKIS